MHARARGGGGDKVRRGACAGDGARESHGQGAGAGADAAAAPRLAGHAERRPIHPRLRGSGGAGQRHGAGEDGHGGARPHGLRPQLAHRLQAPGVRHRGFHPRSSW
jgi:hypothetical protein